MEDARELRKLAEWYRAFAEVGHSEHHEGRLNLAEYLERRAHELEKLAADGGRVRVLKDEHAGPLGSADQRLPHTEVILCHENGPISWARVS